MNYLVFVIMSNGSYSDGRLKNLSEGLKIYHTIESSVNHLVFIMSNGSYNDGRLKNISEGLKIYHITKS